MKLIHLSTIRIPDLLNCKNGQNMAETFTKFFKIPPKRAADLRPQEVLDRYSEHLICDCRFA